MDTTMTGIESNAFQLTKSSMFLLVINVRPFLYNFQILILSKITHWVLWKFHLQHSVLERTMAQESEGRSSSPRFISINLPHFFVKSFERKGNWTWLFISFFRLFWIRFCKTFQVVQSKYSQRLITKKDTYLTRRNNSTLHPISKVILLLFSDWGKLKGEPVIFLPSQRSWTLDSKCRQITITKEKKPPDQTWAKVYCSETQDLQWWGTQGLNFLLSVLEVLWSRDYRLMYIAKNTRLGLQGPLKGFSTWL